MTLQQRIDCQHSYATEDSKNLMCECGDVCDGKIYDCCLYDKSFSEQMELIDEWYKMNKRY